MRRGYWFYPFLQVFIRHDVNLRPVLALESEVMPILGQQGFFESYQVVFERFKRQFEINTK
jgi:hypothetical protein